MLLLKYELSQLLLRNLIKVYGLSAKNFAIPMLIAI